MIFIIFFQVKVKNLFVKDYARSYTLNDYHSGVIGKLTILIFMTLRRKRTELIIFVKTQLAQGSHIDTQDMLQYLL